MKLTGGEIAKNSGDDVTQDCIMTKERKISVSDSESSSTEDGGQRFGVRNYLHHFYEDCAGVALCRSEIIAPDEIEKRQKKKRLVLCVTCAGGLLLAVFGVVILLYSFAETTQVSDEAGKYPVWANYVMMISGASAFCVGGIVVTLCVVMIGIGIIEIKQELLERNQFQERLFRGLSIKQAQQADSTRHYDVKAVQPFLQTPGAHDVTLHTSQAQHSTTVSSQ